MRKLYEKKEILFAVLWIVLYCVVLSSLKGELGNDSIWTLVALIVFSAGITIFVKSNHLEEKYGLKGVPKNMKKIKRQEIWRGKKIRLAAMWKLKNANDMELVSII